jgi:hypothetical protein
MLEVTPAAVSAAAAAIGVHSLLQAGIGSHLQLQQVWEEMRAALQAWLAEGQLPGGLASLDKASYEQAVCTYAVLQEAASKGPEFLEQVRLAVRQF